jgi:hypothetical protein
MIHQILVITDRFSSRIAQWDAVSRRYYYVQLSTGVSQWEVPDKAAPTVPTPEHTPVQNQSPYAQPSPGPTSVYEGEEETVHNPDGSKTTWHKDGTITITRPDGTTETGTSGDRGFASKFAQELIFGKQGRKQGKGGPLQFVGQLAESFMHSGKPSKPSGGSSSGGQSSSGASSGGAAGLMSLASSFLHSGVGFTFEWLRTSY